MDEIHHSMEIMVKSLYRDEPLNILEAGCGPRWFFDLSDTPHKLTGVDLDPDALKYRTDLHTSILGDLHTVELPNNHFDVVYNSFVLEHVKNAKGLAGRFIDWLKPGGLLLIDIPCRDTSFGWLARLFPLWLKTILLKANGHKMAGKPGWPPYPVVYESLISVDGIRDFCKRNGLVIEKTWTETYYTQQWFLRLCAKLISYASFGRLKWEYELASFAIRKKS